MAEQYAQAAAMPAYPGGYIPSKQEQTGECAPAPLDAQVGILLGALTELTQLVDRLEPPSVLKAIRPDMAPHPEGLTALIVACQSETTILGVALRSVAERIGRL